MNRDTAGGPEWSVARLRQNVFRDMGCYERPGHGADHLLRVEKMALRFAPPGSDPNLVSMIAILHDLEDHKFEHRPDTVRGALHLALVPEDIANLVVDEVSRIGFSKRLSGAVPATPEGKAVSDADMCDVMGATGIIRLVEYDAANGVTPFDKSDWPDMRPTAESYAASHTKSMVRHMFEKVLRLPDYMLTDAGRHEALTRKATTVAFLEALFREQDAPEWNVLFDRLYDT